MGMGLIVIATAMFGAALAAFLTGTGRMGILAATAISIGIAVILSTLAVPVFPWDSPLLFGALLRLMALIFVPVFAAAAAGSWLYKPKKDQP